MPYRKNVFVLGAGASACVNAPVMATFLDKAQELLDTGRLSNGEAERFRRVFDYRNQHELAEEKAGLNLMNVEDLFGLIDVNIRVEPERASLRDDFVFLLLKTLDCSIKEEDITQQAIQWDARDKWHSVEARCLEHFVDIVARRWEPLTRMAKDSIISLNYDLVIERAMLGRKIVPQYCLETVSQEQEICAVRLLKLHGSANWRVCRSCDTVEVLSLDKAKEMIGQSSACTRCGEAAQALIVPPTWSKGEYRHAFEKVWQAAFKELLDARRLVLIGVSMPASDRFLRYLFGLALARNLNLDRILIFNTDRETENGALYDNLFERHKRRGHLLGVRVDFAKAIGGSLQKQLDQVYSGRQPSW